jgi:hypothetical protein
LGGNLCVVDTNEWKEVARFEYNKNNNCSSTSTPPNIPSIVYDAKVRPTDLFNPLIAGADSYCNELK